MQKPRINNLDLLRRDDTSELNADGALTDLLDRLNKSQSLLAEAQLGNPDLIPLKANLQKVNSQVLDSPKKRTATWVKNGPSIVNAPFEE